MPKTGIPMDVTNPDDIRAKLPELESLIQTRRRELDRLDAAADKLAAIAGVSRRNSGRKANQKTRGKRPKSSRTLAIAIVNKTNGPVTIDEVTERMDPPMKRDTVGWALWQAAKDEEIQALGGGVYAPLSYTAEELELGTGKEKKT